MNKWPATPIDLIEEYVVHARNTGNSDDKTTITSPEAFVNACGTTYGQDINICLNDGTPVINSVCVGPKNNDTTDGHYLYYYRDHLNKTDPVHDFVEKVKWASNHYKSKDQALFLLAYGGLGLYGGHNDIFIFIQNVMRELGEDYIVIGAQEMVRLAKEQCKKTVPSKNNI